LTDSEFAKRTAFNFVLFVPIKFVTCRPLNWRNLKWRCRVCMLVHGRGLCLDLRGAVGCQNILEGAACLLYPTHHSHRVELAVGVLQMGRYDSELRSHPCLPAETCFSFSPPAPLHHSCYPSISLPSLHVTLRATHL
jgi:hypothetical protein